MNMSEGWRLFFYSDFMSVPLLLGAFVVLSLLVVLFYQLVYRMVPRPVLLALIVLRSLAVLVLLLLIFKPVLSYTKEVMRRAGLCIVADTSRSMSVRDYPNSPSRLERVAAELAPRLASLRDTFDLHLYTFDSVARGPVDEVPTDASGEATNLARAVTAVLDRVPRADLAGVILVSDGVHNAAGDPVEAILGDNPPPVYTVGVGSDLSAESGFQDIGITGLDVPEEATVNTRTEITVRVDATGFADRSIDVHLTDLTGEPPAGAPPDPGGGSRERSAAVATARLVLDGRRGPQEVRLQVTPPQRGSRRYEVAIVLDPKERIEENNRHEFHLWVTEPRIKVLYIETLRPEYGPLKQVLETDPNIDVLALVQVRRGSFLKSGNLRGLELSAFPRTREEMKVFDVFIIGNLHSSFLTRPQMAALRDLVRDEGKALLMTGGSHTLGAGGYGGTSLEDVLPVRVGPSATGQITDPFTMELTPEGRDHEIFKGTGDFFHYRGMAARQELPVLKGCNRLEGVKAGAAVLAVHPTAQLNGKPAPVLAVQEFDGEGRSAVFVGDTTYQWYLYFKVIGRESPYVKFWGQMIRFLAGKDVQKRQTEPGLSFALRKPVFLPGEPVVLQAMVTEQEGRATNFAAVRAEIVQPDGTKRVESLPNVPGSVGLYRATLKPDDPGRYAVTVRAEKDGHTLGAEVAAAFAVSKPNQEFEQLSLNEPLLRRIARETRGEYYRLTTLTDLFDRLRREQTAGSEYTEWPLLSQPVVRLPGTALEVTMTHLLFVVFLGLITVEWLVRRRYLLQ